MITRMGMTPLGGQIRLMVNLGNACAERILWDAGKVHAAWEPMHLEVFEYNGLSTYNLEPPQQFAAAARFFRGVTDVVRPTFDAHFDYLYRAPLTHQLMILEELDSGVVEAAFEMGFASHKPTHNLMDAIHELQRRRLRGRVPHPFRRLP